MTIRLGTNPIAWSNDDMRTLGGTTPLATCLSEARLAGYSGIELGHKFPREAGPLGELLGEHQLVLISGWYSSALLERSPAEEIAAIDGHAGLLNALGCEVLILAETSRAVHGRREVPLSASPSLSSDEIRGLALGVSEVAKHVAGRGLRLAYHHHLGTVIETGDEIDAFMDAAGPEVALLLDTGHAYAAGVDPVALASTYAERIVHVHCKDVRLEILEMVQASEMSFLDGVVAGMFTVPGDGCIDFNAALGPVARAGYAGWLVVEAEQDPEKANPLTYARAGYDHLSAVAETVGFSLQGER
ncbi:MAG: myo-inosose-2 dehydratase [Rhodospirillaceae bacterium]|jgi:inosose dehydratase|nr:myo-inosose-2 dehydratase [Rhodospirillaceae bacterium]MBT6135958.1 myo-inosose-2 dehydratase [Rhodospirillaceae bacterium]